MFICVLASCLTACKDDDVKGPSKASFFGGAFTAKESDGKISLGIQLDQPAKSDVAISLTVGGTATSSVDYTFPETTTTIKAGENTGAFTLTVILDCLAEGDETIEVSMSSASGISASGTYVITIPANSAYVQKNFLGSYACDEPGYKVYDVSFSADANDTKAIINSNFWDVGAKIGYVFDGTGSSVSIPLQTFTANIGAGAESLTVQSQATGSSFDACSGKFIVPYIVKRVSSGATIEINTHTFTKK